MTEGPSERLLIPTLAGVVLVASVVSSLGAPMVPIIAIRYDVDLGSAQWSVTAAMLSGAVATPLAGRLADIGRSRVILVAGIALVVCGCVLAALPTGFAGLMAGRAMQGMGLALVPVAMGIARRFLPPERRAAAIVLIAATTVAGAGFGYPATSLVADLWGLPAVFGVGGVAAGLCLLPVLLAVPSDEHEVADKTVDWWGAMVLGGSTVALLLFVSRGETWGWGSAAAEGSLAVACVLGVFWVTRSLRATRPLIDLRVAAGRTTLAPHLASVLAGAGVTAIMTLVSVIVQAPRSPGSGLGEPTVMAGLALVPYALSSVVTARFSVWLSLRVRREAMVPIGCTFYCCALLLLLVRRDEVWQVLVAMLVAGLGSGLVFGQLAALVAKGVPMGETSSALGLNLVLRYVGHATGGAVMVLLLDVFGGEAHDAHGYDVAILGTIGLWLLTALVTGMLMRRTGRVSMAAGAARPG